MFPYICKVKKKLPLINYFLMLTVLFAMLFQSVHSYEHLTKQLSEKKCYHKYNSSKEITHQHHGFENCFVCNFTLSNFISSNVSHFEFKKTTIPNSIYFFKFREITQFFRGSLFALRAPPVHIV